MRLLQIMAMVAVCSLQPGCFMPTPASVAATGDHPNAHVGRGGPRNGYDFVVTPEVLKKWIREVPQIAKGTPADEVIKRFGEPDDDYPLFAGFGAPYRGRTLTYLVAGSRVNNQGLWPDEAIRLVFDNFYHYENYWVESHWMPMYNADLSEWTRKGPAATTNPTTGLVRPEPAGGW